MKLENIEEARILIAQRNTLLEVIDKADRWNNAHFELVEHCGSHPDRVSMTNFPDLFQCFLDDINIKIKRIEERLKEL